MGIEGRAHGGLVQVAAVERRAVEQDFAGVAAQVAAEPGAERDAEAALRPVEDLVRDAAAVGAAQEPLLLGRGAPSQRAGSEAANSITSGSRSGERASSEWAIVAMSILTSRSPGR